MPNNDYKINRKKISTADDFELLILVLPEDEVEDKLAYLAREKGQITKIFYEDLIIATCIANINQLVFATSNQNDDLFIMAKIRDEVIASIIEANPSLNPNNLILNRNHVVKIKNRDLGDGEKLLVDNKFWNTSISESRVPEPPANENKKSSKDNEKGSKSKGQKNKKELKNPATLEHTIVKKWWKRIGQYVSIKKFEVEYSEDILRQRYFHNRTSFGTFIVATCVVDFEELFSMLDNMGIPNRVAPPLLMHELYELCVSVNDFLTFENAQSMFDEDSQPEAEDKECGSGKKCSSASASNSMSAMTKNKKKKGFKDIQKEDLLRLADSMKVSLIGQNEAVDSMANAIQRASVGLKDPDKPIGSFLFAGKTGVGKSLASKVLADELIKDRNNLLTIDCSEYSADHEYAKLIGCFVPGTQVLMADGTRKSIETIKVGEKVISHTGAVRNVEYTHEYGHSGEMLNITTCNSNISETVTKTHEILAIKNYRCPHVNKNYTVCKPTCKKQYCSNRLYKQYAIDWHPASELNVGDILVYPRYKPTGIYPNKFDLVDFISGPNYKFDDDFVWAQEHVKIPRYIEVGEDLARLAGYYVSEGGAGKQAKTINFTFNSKETAYVIEVVKLLRRLFGKDVHIKIQDRVIEGNSYRIYAHSRLIHNFITTLFGKNTFVKQLPIWFKDLPDNLVRSFLETALFGDGCLVIPRRIDYSTVSINLHSQMELLFRRLGYITSTSVERKTGKLNKEHDRYRLYVGGDQINRLAEEFDLNIDLKDMENTNIQRMTWLDDNYIYKQIKKVDVVRYSGKVYDLAVEKDTSYVIDFAVHNSPPGYVSSDQGGQLTNAIMKNPFSVVVFDEVEKASKKVHELLLQVLEEGRLTDGKGKIVSFKDTIIILTSNIGVSEIDKVKKTIGFGDVNILTEKKKGLALEKALKDKFKPEFLNRLDQIIYFKDLSDEDYMRIIDIELYKLNDNLKNNDTEYKDVEIDFDNNVRKVIFKQGIDKNFGARPLKRCIEKLISTPLAKELLTKEVIDDIMVKVTANKKEDIVFKFKKVSVNPPTFLSEEPTCNTCVKE